MTDDLHIPTYAQLNAMTSSELGAEIEQVAAWIAYGATQHLAIPRMRDGERAGAYQKLCKLRERRDVLVGQRLRMEALTKRVRMAMGEPRRSRRCNVIQGHDFDYATNRCIYCDASPSMG